MCFCGLPSDRTTIISGPLYPQQVSIAAFIDSVLQTSIYDELNVCQLTYLFRSSSRARRMILGELESRWVIHGATDDPFQINSLNTLSRHDEYSHTIKLNGGIRPRDWK
jgi:hypothetical protein